MLKRLVNNPVYKPIVAIEQYAGNFHQIDYSAQRHHDDFGPIYATLEEIAIIVNMAYFAQKIGMEFSSITLLQDGWSGAYKVEIR